jgi:putative acetyltransferase
MHIAIETPDQTEVIELIAALDEYQQSLYPPESTHLLDLESLKQSNVIFVVARDADHQAVGCGAVVVEPDHGELKRMYVHPRGRGRGVAKAIIAKLETEAVNMGCDVLMLESGPFQPEALALYDRCGFERRGPYGDYWDDPLSVFMQKRISG